MKCLKPTVTDMMVRSYCRKKAPSCWNGALCIGTLAGVQLFLRNYSLLVLHEFLYFIDCFTFQLHKVDAFR